MLLRSFVMATSVAIGLLLSPTIVQAAPNPPTPNQQQFISDAHRLGLSGVDATEEISPQGYRLQIGNWPGLSVRDSNILYAGYAICSSLVGERGTNTLDYWRRIYWMLGEPIEPISGYHPKINDMTQSARVNLCP